MALLDLLRDDAWNGISGLLAVAGAIALLARAVPQRTRLITSWLYDRYYEHVRWRLYGPPCGFDEAATLTVKVVGTIETS